MYILNNSILSQVAASALFVICATGHSANAFSETQVASDSAETSSRLGAIKSKKRMIDGIAVTGVNDVLGEPAFSWGEPYGAFGFPTMGIFNENGPEPLKLSKDTPQAALLATYVDPALLFVSNAQPEDVKPEWVNVPLRDVPVNVDFGYGTIIPVPGLLDSDPQSPAQPEPAYPIILSDWMSATGVARIKCSDDGADVRLRLKNLLPNRLYSVWATLGLPKDKSAETFFPIPLGGMPNMFTSDESGDANFERWVNFCPLEPDATERPLLTINVQYHANHQNYGAVPEPGFVPGSWQGLITFNHVVFPVNVETFDN